VWLKNRIPVDDQLGDPTPDAEARIQAFVQDVFRARIEDGGTDRGLGNTLDNNNKPAGNAQNNVNAPITDNKMEVMWFRNRTRWQSIRALEHVHILLRNVPETLVEEWTKQNARDTICERWARGERV
jgi:Protein of unknown function (DUF3605)